MTDKLRRYGSFVLPAVAVLLTIGWGQYQWKRGYEDGADAVLCVMAHQIDGREVAMSADYCQRIKGKKPPLLVALTSDEPQ